jgi:hypothetical protein
MKTFKLTKFAAAAVMVSAVAMAASNVQASTATGSADAVVVAPITISHDSDTLQFGSFAQPTAAETVLVPPTGAHTDSAGIERLAGGATPGGDSFTVGGDSGAAYSVTLPTNGTVTLSNGATGSMAVQDFTSNSTGTITGGSVTLNIGATLNVGASQELGTYTGTYDVTVSYN